MSSKYLDQYTVTRYATLVARLKKLEKKKEILRQEIIEGLSEGLACPRSGPYLVTLTMQERRPVSWKDEFIKLAKEQLGKAWVKYKAKIEDEAEVVKTPMLLTDVNPDYREAEEAKIVEMPSRKHGVA